VDIALSGTGNPVIDDMGDVVDIDSSGGYVGSYHDLYAS
jgi:hypothetical protein